MEDARVKQWWKEASIYQIYPASFCDTTGSGSGDLNGITSKLEYLKDLGVDVVWLSPVYKSPMHDMGYDISDYKAINPAMGTMEDWDRMLAKAHKLGLKLVMDLVVNHTSWDHEWFKQAKKDGPKRDWYIWRPKNPITGKEPNNWGSAFGGSAWKWDEESQEYYLHVFDVSQPDLNWENPDVRDAVWDVMRFWMEKGCDGFRMDVINCISKTPGFPDAPIGPDDDWAPGVEHRFNGPKLKDYLDEMHEKVLVDYPNAFTVGETPGIRLPQDACKLIQHGKPLQMLFNFEHMSVDKGPHMKRPWKLTELKEILGSWFTYMQENDGWDSLYLENHDQPRIVQRWASDAPEHRANSAKMLGIFHIACKGTLFIYQGQETGTANSKAWTRDQLRDVEEVNYYEIEKAKRGPGADLSDVFAYIQQFGRDNARMPMKWDASSPNAGFTRPDATPWLKICEDYEEWNVAVQQGKPDSVLEFWKRLLRIRKEHLALIYGSFEMVDEPNEQIYAFTRTYEEERFLAVCNFSSETVTWENPLKGEAELVIASSGKVGDKGSTLTLGPYEGRLYRTVLGGK